MRNEPPRKNAAISVAILFIVLFSGLAVIKWTEIDEGYKTGHPGGAGQGSDEGAAEEEGGQVGER